MKKIVLAILALLLAMMPVEGQSRKIRKQAKDDAKYELKFLKQEDFKALDNVKLDDVVGEFLLAKYSDRSNVEVVGMASGHSDLNEAKAAARSEAIGRYPANDVSNVFFVYRKHHRKFEVYCYALVSGASSVVAINDPSQYSTRNMNTAASIVKMKADEADKEARAAEKKAKAKQKKAVKKSKAKAKKAAQKAYDKELKKSRS